MAHELFKRIDGTKGDPNNGSAFSKVVTAAPPPWLTPAELDRPEQWHQLPTPTELDALQQQTEQNTQWIQRIEGMIGLLQEQLHDCTATCQSGIMELRQRCGDVEAVLGSTSAEAEGQTLSESTRSLVHHEPFHQAQLHNMVGGIHSELMAERARSEQNIADLQRIEVAGSELSRRLAFAEERLRSTSKGGDLVEVNRELPRDGAGSGMAVHALDLGELERVVAQQIGELGAAQAGGFHRCDTALTAVQRRIESLEKSCSPVGSDLTAVRTRLSSLERRAILMSPRSPQAPSDGQTQEELPAPIQDALTTGLNEARKCLREELVPRVAAAEAACSSGLRHVRGVAAGCTVQLEDMQGEVQRIVMRLSALEKPSAQGSDPLLASVLGPSPARENNSGEDVTTAVLVCKAKEEDTHEKTPDPLSTTCESIDVTAVAAAPRLAGSAHLADKGGPCGGPGQAKLPVQPQANSTSTNAGGGASPLVACRRLSHDPPILSPAPWPNPWATQPQPPQQRGVSPIRSTVPRRESSCPLRSPQNQNPGIRRLSSQQERPGQQRSVSPMQALPPPTQVQVEPLSQSRDGGKLLTQRHSDFSPRPTRQHVQASVVWHPPQQCQGSLGPTRNASPRRSPWPAPGRAGSAVLGGVPWLSGSCTNSRNGSGLVGITLSGGNNGALSGCSTSGGDSGAQVMTPTTIPVPYMTAQRL